MSLSRGALVAPITICLLSATAPAAIFPISEAEAVRTYLEESPLVRLGSLRAEALDASLRTGALARNPEVSYTVEDVADTRDEFLIIGQELPIAGRRSLARQTAERASSAARLDAEEDLRHAVHGLRSTFWEVVYRQQELTTLRCGAEDLGGTVGTLRDRERLGEGPGYDVVRAEQELASLVLQITRAEADHTGALARFRSFFLASTHLDPLETKDASEFMEALPSPEDALSFALSHRADLLSLASTAARHDLERRAARRQRIPEPILAAGIKRVESFGESDGGYVASLIVPVPLFDRGQLRESQARAEAGAIEMETVILRKQIEAEVIAAHAMVRGTREAARSASRLAGKAEDLSRIARIAYEEGEHGILDLLDAHRTSLQMRLVDLEARYEARRAEIQLDRAMGREVRP